MFDGKFDVRLATSSNIIDKIRKLQTKMAAEEVAMVVILSELADSDDEKPTRGPTRSWIKRRKENGFFETIIRELILEELAGFKEMFRMGYADFEKILSSIVVLMSPQEIIFKVYFFIQFLKQKHSNYDVKVRIVIRLTVFSSPV